MRYFVAFVFLPLFGFSQSTHFLSKDCSLPVIQPKISEVKKIGDSVVGQDAASFSSFYKSAYSMVRQKKALQIFNQIKALTKAWLDDEVQKKLAKAQTDENKDLIKSWSERISKRIDQSQVYFGETEVLSSDNISTDYKGNVQLGRWIKLVDSQPEALFLLIAHEMGHVVGPTHMFVKDLELKKSRPEILVYDANYPFDDIVQYVASRARGHNQTCLNDKIQEMKIGHPTLRMRGDIFEKVLSQVTTYSPMVALDYFSFGRTSCPPSQREEGFADVFASGILTRHLKNKSPKDVGSYFSFFCMQVQKEKDSGHQEPDPHSPADFRISDLLNYFSK